jgi:hypothetical protein
LCGRAELLLASRGRLKSHKSSKLANVRIEQ